MTYLNPMKPARPIQVRATTAEGQFILEGDAPGREFEDQYVALSGYCGSYGPSVFSAAPELLEAAKSALFVLQIVYSREPGTNEAGAIALLSQAIDKATAPAPATLPASSTTGEAA